MKTIKRLLWLFLIIVVIVAGVQIKGGYDKYQQALADRPLNEVLEELQNKDNYTQYEDVPEIYYKALVAVEDRRFYKHNGFDIIGTTRAIYNDIKANELLEGGSTISQQLAKNLYFPQDNTLRRKIAEIFMAMKIEREYEKEKSDLITNVAHDLRTPLTSIIGYLELVNKKSDLSDEEQEKYISIVYDKSKRLEKLINDLFEFTKAGADRVKLQLVNLDFKRFMEQMVEEFYPSIEEEKLECRVNDTLTDGMIIADPDLLARGIANLFSNAIKYGKDGKVIKVDLKENEKSVYVTITNYGEIIPEKDLEHIFDKFFRVEGSRSAKTGGTGLGLAILKKIVLLHHGKIQVSSDYKGTIFSIELPKEIPEYQKKK